MKEFNKTQELRKIKLKQNKNTYIKRISIILSCVILLVGIIMFTFAKFESNKSYTLIQGKLGDYSSDDVTLSYIVDGVSQSVPPAKGTGYKLKEFNCTNADGVWDKNEWSFKLLNMTGKVKCNLEFYIPDYSYEEWLTTANINENFNTLDDLLQDQATIRLLLTNNDSANYVYDWYKYDSEIRNELNNSEYFIKWLSYREYCADLFKNDEEIWNIIKTSNYYTEYLNNYVSPSEYIDYSSRTYIYDHGLEVVSVSSDEWDYYTGSYNYYDESVTKDKNYIIMPQLYTSNGAINDNATVGTDNLFDITGYNKLKIEISSEQTMDNIVFVIQAGTKKRFNWSDYTNDVWNRTNGISSTSFTFDINISSVNKPVYLSYSNIIRAANSRTPITYFHTMWLE